jgi:hypothetical protein
VAIPFAKLQAAPLAAVLGLYWIGRVARLHPSRRAALSAAVCGGILLGCVILGPVFISGAGREFWTSYYLANKNYALSGSWDPPSSRYVWGLNWLLLATGILVGAAFIAAPRPLLRHLAFQLGAALAVAAVFAIFLPGYPILHYWLLLTPGLVLLNAAALATIRIHSRRVGVIACVAVAALALLFVAKRNLQTFVRWEEQLAVTPTINPIANARIQRLSGLHDRLAVWGWAPELYVLNGRPQATREAHTFAQINPGPLRDHFRARFLEDIQRTRPAVFVDAVTPGAFTYADRARYGHESFPALKEWIDIHYEFVGDVGGLRLYRRRDLAQKNRDAA